jgi:hypothetical protein
VDVDEEEEEEEEAKEAPQEAVHFGQEEEEAGERAEGESDLTVNVLSTRGVPAATEDDQPVFLFSVSLSGHTEEDLAFDVRHDVVFRDVDPAARLAFTLFQQDKDGKAQIATETLKTNDFNGWLGFSGAAVEQLPVKPALLLSVTPQGAPAQSSPARLRTQTDRAYESLSQIDGQADKAAVHADAVQSASAKYSEMTQKLKKELEGPRRVRPNRIIFDNAARLAEIARKRDDPSAMSDAQLQAAIQRFERDIAKVDKEISDLKEKIDAHGQAEAEPEADAQPESETVEADAQPETEADNQPETEAVGQEETENVEADNQEETE